MDRDDHALSPTLAHDLSRVPARWRTQVDRWRLILDQLTAGEVTKADVVQGMHVSLATLNRKITRYAEHGLMGLVPNYQPPPPLPKAFVDYWKTLQETYQRKTSAAIRELFRRWHDRHPIPGYTGHPGWPALPWTKRTLYRYQPSKLELTSLRHGLGRAKMKHGPKILSTRYGMHHLAFLTGDDVKLDMKGHILTRRDLCCPLQVGFMDVRSGSRFKWGTKPQLLKDDAKGRMGIEEGDVRFLLCGQLLETGLSLRGTTYLLEHGTFTFRGRVIDILNRYYGPKGILQPGCFNLGKSGMIGKAQAICGMSDGRGGGGNPFFKAWLESLHNLMHNELAALPAQVGHDRDEPEHFGVIEREVQSLFKLAAQLPPDLAAALKFPTKEFHTQLVPLIDHILGVINRRTDHNLEGWERCGFLTRSYRLTADSQEWKTDDELLALPSPVRDAYLHMAQADKRCFLPRKLSPHEVFSASHELARQNGELVQIPQSVIAEILYEDLARPMKCRDGSFSFTDGNVSPEPLHFESRVLGPDGREAELTDRETYDVVVNPFDLRHLYVFSAVRSKGSFLGTARRIDRITRGDQAAAERAFGRANERLADMLGDQRRRNTGRTTEAAARKAHNAAVAGQLGDRAAEASRLLTESLATSTPNTQQTDEHNEDQEPNW